MWCEERRLHLANEIHDTVLQELIHLKRKAETYQQGNDLQQMKNHFSDIEKDIKEIAHLLKKICTELYPPFLSEFGLRRSLQDLVEKMQSRTHIILKLNLKESFISSRRLNKDLELALYRITQKLLNNAIKHSKANWLMIKMSIFDQNIKLQYTDDGIGMDIEQLHENVNQIGLIGMKERVQTLKGNIYLKSEPNKGMQVEVSIPAILT